MINWFFLFAKVAPIWHYPSPLPIYVCEDCCNMLYNYISIPSCKLYGWLLSHTSSCIYVKNGATCYTMIVIVVFLLYFFHFFFIVCVCILDGGSVFGTSPPISVCKEWCSMLYDCCSSCLFSFWWGWGWGWVYM